MMTEVVLKILVYSLFNNLTWLLSQENFIECIVSFIGALWSMQFTL